MTAFPDLVWEAAVGYDPLDTSPTYTSFLASDGSTRLVSASVSRALGRAGTSTSVLDNSDGALNQWNIASQYFGNLLEEVTANPETSTLGWTIVTNCTLATSTFDHAIGAGSLEITATVAGAWSVVTTNRFNVVAGKVYTPSIEVRAREHTENISLTVRWWNDAGVSQGSSIGGTVVVAATFAQLGAFQATAPVGATKADLFVAGTAIANGDRVYLDAAQLQAGTSSAWTPGGRGGNMQPVLKIRCRAQWNKLTLNQSSLETDTTGWVAQANCTISRSTTVGGNGAAGGAAALRLSSSASGDMAAITSVGTGGVPVVPLKFYSAVAAFTSAVSSRTAQVQIWWYDSGGTFVSAVSTGANITSSAGVYTMATTQGQAPATAAYAGVYVVVRSTGGAAELHYVDTIGLFPAAGVTDWSPGGGYYLFTQFVNRWGSEWENIKAGDCAVTGVDAFRFLTLAKKPGTAYFDAQMANTPAALYRLNETNRSATDTSTLIYAVDSSGNALDALYKGTAPNFGVAGAMPGEIGTAAGFQRGPSGSWVEVPITACPSGTGDFTIEAWIRPRSISSVAPVDQIWHVANIGSQSVYLVLGLDGKPSFTANTAAAGGTLPATTAVTLDLWNHIVAVKSGTAGPTNWRIYLNGVDVSDHGAETLNGTGNVSITTNDALLGGYEISGVGQGAFDGDLDEVAIYLSALSAGTVATHYDANFGFNEPALSGTRINSILDLRNFPAGDRNIDAGQFIMQPVIEPLYDTPPLAYIATGEGSLVESEGWPAAFFVDAEGKAVFQDRAHSTPASSASFSDASSTLYYDPGPGPERNDEDIWPQVVLQSATGQPQTAGDAAADTRYGGQTLTRTGLRNADDADVLTMAEDLRDRYSTPRDRLASLTIHPIDEPGTMWPQVLGRELNDVITVTRTDLPGGGAPFTGDFRITGITHQIGPGSDWFTTWELVPA